MNAVLPGRATIGPPVGGGVPHVLVIDDDDALREAVSSLLVLEGFVVTVAADGDEGLRALRADPSISVVLLDLMMPRADGIHFRRAQLADESIRAIPVILMTGSIRLTAIDADDVVTKPLNTWFLIQSIRRLAARTRC